MKRLRRQLPFLRSVVKEANRFKGQELLQHANADQVNAVSELVLNLLKQNIPVTPATMNQLRPYESVLRTWAVARIPLKNDASGSWLKKVVGCGKGSTPCCVNVFDGETLDVGDPFARRQPGTRSMGRGLSILEA